jgi:hypothetical protein
LNYRLEGNENSVKPEFFNEGNAAMSKMYGKEFPWLSATRIERSIGPGIVLVE